MGSSTIAVLHGIGDGGAERCLNMQPVHCRGDLTLMSSYIDSPQKIISHN